MMFHLYYTVYYMLGIYLSATNHKVTEHVFILWVVIKRYKTHKVQVRPE